MAIRDSDGLSKALEGASSSRGSASQEKFLKEELKKVREEIVKVRELSDQKDSRRKEQLSDQREQNRLLRVQNHKLEETGKELKGTIDKLKNQLKKEASESSSKDFKVKSMEIENQVFKQNFEALLKEPKPATVGRPICNDLEDAKVKISDYFRHKGMEKEEEVKAIVKETDELIQSLKSKRLRLDGKETVQSKMRRMIRD